MAPRLDSRSATLESTPAGVLQGIIHRCKARRLSVATLRGYCPTAPDGIVATPDVPVDDHEALRRVHARLQGVHRAEEGFQRTHVRCIIGARRSRKSGPVQPAIRPSLLPELAENLS